jgi:hypothetical protein
VPEQWQLGTPASINTTNEWQANLWALVDLLIFFIYSVVHTGVKSPIFTDNILLRNQLKLRWNNVL